MKSYDEIAKKVFERRDKYISKQKKKKKIVIGTVTPLICCGIAFAISLSLLKSNFFSSNIPVLDNSQNVSENVSDVLSAENQSSSRLDTSSKNSSSSKTSSGDNTSQSVSTSDNSASVYSEQTPNVSSDTQSAETNYFIDSVDKINFYSAKKIISEKSLLPIGMRDDAFLAPKISWLNNGFAEYPIDRNKVFTTTMVTYFTIQLNNENGFLAHKLGGTGLVEVVVTQNDIDDMGQMITFKLGEKYYTCFANGGTNDPDSNRMTREFSSHKYIEGFSIIKNKEQENYTFTVDYEGSKVVGFRCAKFSEEPTSCTTDDVTLVEDFCVVLYTKQTFTIDELEMYFKNENEGENV